MALLLESYYSKIIADRNNRAQGNAIIENTNFFIHNFFLKYAAKLGAEDYYANYHSVITYPKYLFKVDKKYTNEKTINNICILPVDMKLSNIPSKVIGDYKMCTFKFKAELFKQFLIYQRKIFNLDWNNLSEKRYLRSVCRRIRFFNMTIENIDIEKLYIEITEVMKEIYNNGNGMLLPLLAVVHFDEEYPHVHFLYAIDVSIQLPDRRLRHVPHIDNVIKTRYDSLDKIERR